MFSDFSGEFMTRGEYQEWFLDQYRGRYRHDPWGFQWLMHKLLLDTMVNGRYDFRAAILKLNAMPVELPPGINRGPYTGRAASIQTNGAVYLRKVVDGKIRFVYGG